MVFMNVAFEQVPFAARHVREMARVGSDERLNIVVQVRNFIGNSERLFIRHKTVDSCASLGRRNPESRGPVALRAFLDWAAENFPAERYMLVLWGHSYGLRFGRDDRDALTVHRLGRTLKTFKRRRHGRNLDILGFNSCTMSCAEAAYELSGAVDWMIAPQGDMPFAGWPYQTMLDQMRSNPSIQPVRLGSSVVRHFVKSYQRRHVALTLLDLRRGARLKTAIAELTAALDRASRRGKHRPDIENAFRNAASCKRVRPLIDLVDLCGHLKAVRGDRRLRRAAVKAMELVRVRSHGLVRAHASRGRTLERLHGVGIYAAHVTDKADWRTLNMRTDHYKGLELNQVTRWDTLAQRLGSTL